MSVKTNYCVKSYLDLYHYVTAFIVLLIIFYIYYSSFKWIGNKKIHYIFKVFYILVGILILTQPINEALLPYICRSYLNAYPTFRILMISTYFLTLVLSLISIIVRFKFVFDRSVFKINNSKINVLIFLVALNAIVSIICIIILLTWGMDNIFIYRISLTAAGVTRVFYMSLFWYTIVMFHKKISETLLELSYSDCSSAADILLSDCSSIANDTEKSDKNLENEIRKKLKQNRNLRLINVSSKYLVLAIFMFIISMIAIVASVMQSIFGRSLNDIGYVVSNIISTTLLVDCLCNFISMYLQYGYTQSTYEKLCSSLHGYMQTKLLNTASKSMVKRIRTNSHPIDL